MLHIVMDGAGDMPPEWRGLYNIDVLGAGGRKSLGGK